MVFTRIYRENMSQEARKSSPREPHVVIVDPYSSGTYLVEEFKKYSFPLIGIQSSQELADFWLNAYDASKFSVNIKHESMEKTLAELRNFNIVACVPGSEPGVFLAEDIQTGLELPNRNGAETKEWRRHKYHQTERLHECGLRAIRQIYAKSYEDFSEWHKTWGKWPVIIKPAMSGGTDGVYWCHQEKDCRLAFEKELGRVNVNGAFNDGLLCQEFLNGTEYIVDCCSYEGKHVLNGIWRYKKIYTPEEKSIAYEYAELLPSDGDVQEKLYTYIFKVLDALAVKFGPTHNEVIIMDGEPCLVESGARMQGGTGCKLTELSTGIGSHEVVADIYVNNGRLFKQMLRNGPRYFFKKAAFHGCMYNGAHHGYLKNDLDAGYVMETLPSVYSLAPNIGKGQYLKLTRDLASAPGYIDQVHPVLEQCYKDVAKLRVMERDELFTVQPTPLESESESEPLLISIGPKKRSQIFKNACGFDEELNEVSAA